MKKKMKALEDKIKALTGTNAALTDTVRVLQKEQSNDLHDGNKDGNAGNNDDNSDDSSSDHDRDSPMYFKAREVRIPHHSGLHFAH